MKIIRKLIAMCLFVLYPELSAQAEGLMSSNPDDWEFQHIEYPAGIADQDIAAFSVTVERCEKLLIGTNNGNGLFIKNIGQQLDHLCRTVLAPPKRGDPNFGTSPPPWRQVFSGKSVRKVATGSGVIIAAVSEGTLIWPETLYRSLDGGERWEVVHSLPDSSYVRRKLFISPHDDGRLMVAPIRDGDNSYYIRSINKGQSWRRHEYGDVFVDENQIIWDIVELSHLVKQPTGSLHFILFPEKYRKSTIFMSGEYGNEKEEDYQPILLKSEDFGTTWINIARNLPEDAQWHASSMDVDFIDINTRRLYHQCEGGATAWSDDYGEVWNYEFSGFFKIIADPQSSGLVLSRPDGVYIMQTPPIHSHLLNENRVRVTSIMSNPSIKMSGGGRWLWARSYTDGLWLAEIPRE